MAGPLCAAASACEHRGTIDSLTADEPRTQRLAWPCLQRSRGVLHATIVLAAFIYLALVDLIGAPVGLLQADLPRIPIQPGDVRALHAA